jgi:hypothetical protein
MVDPLVAMNAIKSALPNASESTSPYHYRGEVLGKLSDFESITGRLEAGGRVLDTYELEGEVGYQVRLRLTSEDFRVLAFVVLGASASQPGREPFVQKIAGDADRATGGVEAQASITLPATGTYRVVVTSLDNEAQQRAISSGEYRMTLLVDTPKSLPAGFEVPRPIDSRPSAPEDSGPGSQKGARFSAWESDSP